MSLIHEPSRPKKIEEQTITGNYARITQNYARITRNYAGIALSFVDHFSMKVIKSGFALFLFLFGTPPLFNGFL